MDDTTLRLYELGEEYHEAFKKLIHIYRDIDKQIESLNDTALKDALGPIRKLDFSDDNLALVHSVMHYHGCRLYGIAPEKVKEFYDAIDKEDE